MTTGTRHPMKGLCEEWLKKINIAKKVKHERFGQYADEAARFYNGSHDWMWDPKYSQGNGGFLSKDARNLPTFRMTVNRVFEAVALFGPALYHQYPNILVTTVKPPVIAPEALGFHLLGVDTSVLQNPDPATMEGLDPQMVQQIMEAAQQQQAYQQIQQEAAYEEAQKSSCASVKQHVLNWLQIEGNKRAQSRRSITECIVKGAGYLLTEIYQPRGSQRKYPRSTHISCDHIFKDPDAAYHEDVQWVAIYYKHPRNLVERKFGLKPGDLIGHKQSYNSQVTPTAKRQARNNKQNPGESFDLVEYYEIYSKNGFGDRLKSSDKMNLKSKYSYEQFGDFCRIVVAEGVPFPLNMPTWSLEEPDQALFMRSQWPIPFWTDEGCGSGWPFAELGFYENPGCVWPISLIKPAIGELRFVNWCMSFLADKVAASCTTYVAILKDAGVEIQNQLKGQSSPFTVIELSQIFGKSIQEIVSFLEAPGFSQDIWKMVAEVLDLIDKRTGLTDLIYGLTGTQIRSAQEATIRDQNTNIRPDDMASKTEDWLSESAMKEIEAAAWSCEGFDFQEVLGTQGVYVWDTYVRGQEFENIVRDYKYRIEAGSARKPNKASRLRSLSEFSQVAMPVIQEMALAGNFKPWNALVKDYGEAMDLDASGYMMDPLPAENGPSPEEIKAEMEMKKMELEMAMKQEEMAMKREEHEMDLEFKREEHDMEMDQKKEEFQLTLNFEKEKSKEQTKVMKEQTKAKKEQADEMGKIKIDTAKAQAKAKAVQAKAKPKASKA